MLIAVLHRSFGIGPSVRIIDNPEVEALLNIRNETEFCNKKLKMSRRQRIK